MVHKKLDTAVVCDGSGQTMECKVYEVGKKAEILNLPFS